MIIYVPHLVNTNYCVLLGKDGSIHVWKVFNKEPESILTGAHSKGVCSLSFSNSGILLASVGIDDCHTIAIWNWREGSLISKVDGSQYRIFQVLCITTPKSKQSNQIDNLSLITCGISHIKYWCVTGSNMVSERLSLGIDTPCETMLSILECGDQKIIVGSLSGTMYIFQDLLISNTIKLHNGPIWALASHPDGILSGSRGSSDIDVVLKLSSLEGVKIQEIISRNIASDIRAIDSINNMIIVGTNDSMIIQIKDDIKTILNQGHGYGELWGLAIHPSKMIAITASHDSCIKSWDLCTKRIISTLKNLSGPAQSIDINPNADLIAAGFCNGQFTLFELKENGTLEMESAIKKKRDYSSTINIIKFSPDGTKLAVACSKNFVDIYKLPHLIKHATCKGFKGITSNLDWSHDSNFIQINTLQYQRLIYQISDANLILDNEVIGKIIWSTLTCVSGPDLLGIWSEDSESGDVNNSHLSNRGHILATGDDYGLVKLFNFPVNKKNATYLQFHGHSAHVTNLRFTCNDDYLVTTGGDDSCVFLWKTIKDV
ncbi:Echinoderm microtubule-associated protein-like 5 [Oopsacas minuta]|uniref:Echinoderm microtubule-associated protein-like 5 n=1 Tax=Oopsacas minuta TaxID=111878 RepID=A0AAV7K7R7_9METZ|nr:Echinoderm microtubule-associated protein-like 5 [Oopsacas minuta]